MGTATACPLLKCQFSVCYTDPLVSVLSVNAQEQVCRIRRAKLAHKRIKILPVLQGPGEFRSVCGCPCSTEADRLTFVKGTWWRYSWLAAAANQLLHWQRWVLLSEYSFQAGELLHLAHLCKWRNLLAEQTKKSSSVWPAYETNQTTLFPPGQWLKVFKQDGQCNS